MKSLGLDSLPFNWFDVTVVILLIVGVLRGRKRGMSQEFLDVTKWIAIVFAAGFFYQPIGDMLAQNQVFGRLTGYLVAYICIVFIVLAIFIYVKRAIGGKLIGSDRFGKAEYPLGMIAGLIRFTCMIFVALAILNARFYSQAEVDAAIKYQNDNYGSNFFPTLEATQTQVFQKSPIGKFIKGNLEMLMIKPTAPEQKKFKQKEFQIP